MGLTTMKYESPRGLDRAVRGWSDEPTLMLPWKKAVCVSTAFVASAFAVAILAAPAACGGCYVDDEVADLRSEPPSDCLVLTANSPDVCTGDYDIDIQNNCAETLTLASVVIAPGSAGNVAGGTAESKDGTHMLTGTLGSDPMKVLWRLVPGDG